MAMGELSINVQQVKEKFKVTADNAHRYSHILAVKGLFFTLDARPYMEELNEFGIFYTFTPVGA